MNSTREITRQFHIPDWQYMTVRQGRSPERRLLLAILNRAILDYYKTSATTEQYDAYDATCWLTSHSDKIFSCRWVCEHLGLNQSILIHAIKNKVLTQVSL